MKVTRIDNTTTRQLTICPKCGRHEKLYQYGVCRSCHAKRVAPSRAFMDYCRDHKNLDGVKI